MDVSGSNKDHMVAFPFAPEEKKIEKADRLAEYRANMLTRKRERPDPNLHMRVAVYIRYFNTTEHENYLDVIKSRYDAVFAVCKNWEFVGFYIDEGATAPVMERAEAWSQLLCDCMDNKVDLIVTKKISDVSKIISEMTICARILASLEHPVAIYFESNDVFTGASYFQNDLRDTDFFPPGWEVERITETKIAGELNE